MGNKVAKDARRQEQEHYDSCRTMLFTTMGPARDFLVPHDYFDTLARRNVKLWVGCRSILTTDQVFNAVCARGNHNGARMLQTHAQWFHEWVQAMDSATGGKFCELPACFVLLEAPVDICMERMKKRGRAGEEKVELDYMVELNEQFSLFADHLATQGVKVLRMNTAHRSAAAVAEELAGHCKALVDNYAEKGQVMRLIVDGGIGVGKSATFERLPSALARVDVKAVCQDENVARWENQGLLADMYSCNSKSAFQEQIGAPASSAIIAVIGNIGAGKSTLIAALEKAMPDMLQVPEPVDIWDGTGALAAMYNDPVANGFPFQVLVCTTRARALKDAAQVANGRTLLLERSAECDREVFVEALRKQDAFSALQTEIYDTVCASVADGPQVTHYVWLDATPAQCYDRIQTRGRTSEQPITLSQLEGLDRLHRLWLKRTEGNKPVMVVSGDLPYHESAAAATALATRIRAFVEA